MFAIILKSHNGTIHRVWTTKKGFTLDELKEIEDMAGYYNQEVAYIEIEGANEDISAEEVQLDISKLNTPKEPEHRLD